jgi:hypothetical protein
MVDLSAPTKPMFFYVPKRDHPTLMSYIRKYIPQGSTVVSDGWRGYIGVSNYNYLHLTVNHNANFVDPRTGV